MTIFTIKAVWKLPTGEYALVGDVEGFLLSVGVCGVCDTSEGRITIEIVGVAMVDPLRDLPGRRGILARIQERGGELTEGLIIYFKTQPYKEKGVLV